MKIKNEYRGPTETNAGGAPIDAIRIPIAASRPKTPKAI